MSVLTARDHQILATCDPRLQNLCEFVAKYWSFSVLDGHRDQKAQDLAYSEGKSQLKWPNGKHNSYPSLAVDLAPTPLTPGLRVDWSDTERFLAFADFVTGAARRQRIALRWGGDWDGDPASLNRFNDLVHFELRP